MNITFGQVVEISVERLNRLLRELEQAFELVPEVFRLSYTKTLNFAAPGAVPGITSQTVTIQGVEVGDMILVGAPNAAPAGFLPPFGEVTAADTIKIHWYQFSGVAADPDGAGGVYNIDVLRH